LRSDGSETRTGYIVVLAVLGVALLAEGSSLVRALVQIRGNARRASRGMVHEIRAGDDPALRTVLAEDSTACLGVVLAIVGVGLHMLTGDIVYEAWASLLIGALLVFVAFQLASQSRDQLIGEAADPVLRSEIHEFLDEQREIDMVSTLLTMRLGTRSTLVAVRVDLVGGMDSEEVEEVLVRIKSDMNHRWPLADQVFLDVTEATAMDRARAAGERRELNATVEAQGGRERGEGKGTGPEE
ncbi:cation diffusion facilitator family transporter, partial [Streptomyces sp. NPDC048425]|uniref:cation diffusion facilitator family transporter n=1 Tax=Streptomyces sp. NPDC048425 TaxID=3365548 RepID=UPI00371516CD